MSNYPTDHRPAELIGWIADLTVEQQIDTVMYYCRMPIIWRTFMDDPTAQAWLDTNCKVINARVRIPKSRGGP